MGAHVAHESAAWNLAMGASFLAVAVKPSRAVGTLPILATFLLVLSVLSVPDLIAGAVEPARLASHVGVLLGLILVALVSRASRLPAPGRGQASRGRPSRDRPEGDRPGRDRTGPGGPSGDGLHGNGQPGSAPWQHGVA
jgi:predicted anti-sigma-YlaC factor YlaD